MFGALLVVVALGTAAEAIAARISHPLISHTPSPEGLNKQYRYDANGELTRRADARLNLYQFAANADSWVDPWGWACFYRGSKKGEPVSFQAKPGEYKIDSQTGLVKTTHGVSVFDNPGSVRSKGFIPNKVDINSVGNEIKIIQRGNDLRHFEIVPASPMPLENYQAALSRIKVI